MPICGSISQIFNKIKINSWQQGLPSLGYVDGWEIEHLQFYGRLWVNFNNLLLRTTPAAANISSDTNTNCYKNWGTVLVLGNDKNQLSFYVVKGPFVTILFPSSKKIKLFLGAPWGKKCWDGGRMIHTAVCTPWFVFNYNFVRIIPTGDGSHVRVTAWVPTNIICHQHLLLITKYKYNGLLS